MASRILSLVLLGIVAMSALGQPAAVEEKPFPRPEADGPTSFVTAAALSPDGKTLYVAGWDKLVHVWRLDDKGKFALDRAATFRVPIGPGLEGSLNALALSPNGQWLAVAGQSLPRGSMNYRNHGFILKRIPLEVLRDRGVIHVFDTRTRAVKQLRGHEGQVLSLAFASNGVLTSIGQEWDADREVESTSLRAWDVDKGTNTATLRDQPLVNVRPGLAAWTAGGKWRAAASFNDGKLRVWDGGPRAGIAADGDYNVGLADLAARDMVLSTSYSQRKGRLQGWKLGGADPEADKAMLASFVPTREATGTTFYFPRAVTLFASKAKGPIDYAAVILRTAFSPDDGQAPRPEDDRLQIVRILPNGRLAPVLTKPIVVARGGGTQPVMTASANGRHLVIAGYRTHEVQVFAIADVLAGQAQPQILRSVAETMRYVGFVKKGKERGLVLNPLPAKGVRAPAAGDLIFDFANRKLGGDTAGWQVDAPAAGGWTLAPAEHSVSPTLNKKPISTIDVANAKNVVTGYAFLPGEPPLLALATNNLREIQLNLYNAQTGQMIQRLIGHTAPIRSLAFSGDGKLLTSTAEDQTVSVWTLADFAKVLNRNGAISGLALREENKTVIVTEIEATSQAKGKLKEGDVIEGLVEAGKLKPVATAHEFYQAVWLITPNTPATLRIKGRGDIAVVVGQGVETRNPLFSLFIIRGAVRDWLGWSPTGPYDSSRAEVERHLGWHINTGKPEAPTRFAEAGQYKKEYYRPDLLKHLVAKGKLDQALEEWERDTKEKKQSKKLPEPQINLRLAEAGPDPLRRDGDVVVRQQPQTLRLAIDNFAADDVGSVKWTIAGLSAEPQPFTPGQGREYVADVSKLPWQRGVYKVRVEIQTQEDTPRKYTQELPLRYQPLPPEVVAMTGRQVVDKPEFTYKATVKPGVAGQDVQVRLIQRHQGKEVLSEVQANQIVKALKLLPGDNLIEVVAVNKDVPADLRDLETTREVVEVTYQPPVPDPTPIITLESVQPKGRSLQPIVPGRPIVVDAAKVIVRGKIAASKNLAKADWAKDKVAARPLAKFTADQSKDFSFAEEVTLTPGTQQVRVTAATAKSEPAEAAVAIEFRPPLPQLVLTAPQAGLIHYEGRDPAEVEVRFQAIDFQPEYPFQATVLVNDKPAQAQPVLDAKTGTLTAKVPLAHGDNRIQLRLKNQWDVEAAAEDIVVVRYLLPPRIAKVDAPAESEQSLVDITASVVSALPLLPGSVDAEISNAAAGTRRRISTFEVMKDGPAWTVRLKDVPLEVGSNEVRLLVSNSDARALEPATRTIVYKKKAPLARAEVEILDPRVDSSVTEPIQTLTFKVTSKSPLRHLDLVRQGASTARQVIDVSKLAVNKDGTYEVKLALKLDGTGQGAIDPTKLTANSQGILEGAASIQLVKSTNLLRVEAVNDGGQTEASVVINVLRRPAELVLDRLEPRGGQGVASVAEPQEGPIVFPPVDQGRVVLHGRVKWDEEDDSQLREINTVQVYVNGLRQPPVPLAMPVGKVRERAFQAPLNLTGASNTIEVELPTVVLDSSVRRQATVACLKPESQRLHLLIVGVDDKNETELTERVLAGLHAENIDLRQRRFSMPNFAEGRLYPPLVGYVRPGQVLTELRRIKDEVDLLARAGSTSDVVMVYFAGKKAQQGTENYCLTSVSQHVPDLRRSALAFSSLAACLADTLGGQLVLLNVDQTGDAVGAGGAGDYLKEPRSRVGLVCYEWAMQAPESQQLTGALGQAMSQSANLGQLAKQLDLIAQKISEKQQVLTCHENITGGHQLRVLPLGVKP